MTVLITIWTKKPFKTSCSSSGHDSGIINFVAPILMSSIISGRFAPLYGSSPVSISQMTMPNLQMQTKQLI